MDIFYTSCIFLLGLLMFLKPEFVWYIKHFWDTEGGSPSDAFINSTKIIGFIAGIVGIVSLIIVIFN